MDGEELARAVDELGLVVDDEERRMLGLPAVDDEDEDDEDSEDEDDEDSEDEDDEDSEEVPDEDDTPGWPRLANPHARPRDVWDVGMRRKDLGLRAVRWLGDGESAWLHFERDPGAPVIGDVAWWSGGKEMLPPLSDLDLEDVGTVEALQQRGLLAVVAAGGEVCECGHDRDEHRTEELDGTPRLDDDQCSECGCMRWRADGPPMPCTTCGHDARRHEVDHPFPCDDGSCSCAGFLPMNTERIRNDDAPYPILAADLSPVVASLADAIALVVHTAHGLVAPVGDSAPTSPAVAGRTDRRGRFERLDTWLALRHAPPCVCGHRASRHSEGEGCAWDGTGDPCPCPGYRAAPAAVPYIALDEPDLGDRLDDIVRRLDEARQAGSFANREQRLLELVDELVAAWREDA